MSRKKRVHRVKVERRPAGVDENRRRNLGIATAHEEVWGLMEPRNSRASMETATAVGTIVQTEWVFTWWGGETIQAGDTITWLDANLTLVVLEKPTRDLYRVSSRIGAYQTVNLVEKAT